MSAEQSQPLNGSDRGEAGVEEGNDEPPGELSAIDEPTSTEATEPAHPPPDSNDQQDAMNGQSHDPQHHQQEHQRDSELPDIGPSNEANRPLLAKTVFFHREGTQKKVPVRMAIHPTRYRGLDSLLTELTDRMPELNYGVRAVFTPKGRDRIASMEELANQGHYVCSTSQKRAAPVDPVTPSRSGPAWRAGGGKFRNGTAPDPARPPQPLRREGNKSNSKSYPSSEPDDVSPAPYAPTFRSADCKRIYVRKNGEPFKKHIVLLNKRTVRDYEHVLDDLSGIFQMQVRRLFTVDGEPVESLSGIYNGPETFVVAGTEKFRPVLAWSGDDGGSDGVKGGKAAPQAFGRRSKEGRPNAVKSSEICCVD